MTHGLLDRLVIACALLFALDRLLKLLAVVHFMRRPPDPAPAAWPSVSLVQPITHGATNLADNLRARAALAYPSTVQHLLVCDEGDDQSREECHALLADYPHLQAELVVVSSSEGAPTSKITKLRAGLALASGEVICSIDDDVAPRPDTLSRLLAPLQAANNGAVFGLACYTSWDDTWSSLMSAFVNANALLSYVPLCYLVEPFTITGHLFALRRATLDAVGGFDGMEQRIDDDHELARRIRRAGLRVVQTPVIYDVANKLDRRSYAAQMHRWFVIPREAMLPWLTARERLMLVVGSCGNLLPGLIALLAVVTRRRTAWLMLGTTLTLHTAVYALCEHRYLKRGTPLWRRPLVILTALATPFHIIWAILSGNAIRWRGQRLYLRRGGYFERMP